MIVKIRFSERRRELMMRTHVLKTCGKCDNAFDEESDEASCAVPCIECEKRFLTKKIFNKHHGLYHELEVQ